MAREHTDLGKWSLPGVPHKGWSFVDIEDLGEPDKICEMCESRLIRYVHYMEHLDYPERLGVGCICAENMEQDYVAPRLREKKLRSAARRRANWARRIWMISQKGNLYMNVGKFNLTAFSTEDEKGRYWKLRVANRVTGHSQFGRRRFPSVEAAKLAGFDALAWAKQKLVH